MDRGHAKSAGKVKRPASAAPRSVHNEAKPNPGVGKMPRDHMTTHKDKSVTNPKL